MKHSLMRPPAITEIYNQKLYLFAHSAPTKTTSRNSSRSEKTESTSYSLIRPGSLTSAISNKLKANPSPTNSMNKIYKSTSLTSNFLSNSKAWNPSLVTLHTLHLTESTKNPPSSNLSQSARSSRPKRKTVASIWRWNQFHLHWVKIEWWMTTLKPKGSKKESLSMPTITTKSHSSTSLNHIGLRNILATIKVLFPTNQVKMPVLTDLRRISWVITRKKTSSRTELQALNTKFSSLEG